jgi:hypothetical protein
MSEKKRKKDDVSKGEYDGIRGYAGREHGMPGRDKEKGFEAYWQGQH